MPDGSTALERQILSQPEQLEAVLAELIPAWPPNACAAGPDLARGHRDEPARGRAGRGDAAEAGRAPTPRASVGCEPAAALPRATG
jgi:hypothetical protein